MVPELEAGSDGEPEELHVLHNNYVIQDVPSSVTELITDIQVGLISGSTRVGVCAAANPTGMEIAIEHSMGHDISSLKPSIRFHGWGEFIISQRIYSSVGNSLLNHPFSLTVDVNLSLRKEFIHVCFFVKPLIVLNGLGEFIVL